MGLDNFASSSPDDIVLSEEDIQAFNDAQIELCGGIFSGNDGSFRGKVYAELIYDITGQSLYQEWIPPETVQEMYQALSACDPQEEADFSAKNSLQEVIALTKFFKVCSDRHLGIIAWS